MFSKQTLVTVALSVAVIAIIARIPAASKLVLGA